MATTNVTIRMDVEMKKQAELLFSDLGMNLTTAFTIFTKQAIREQRIPFTISKGLNAETLQVIDEARRGINLSKSFSSVDELMSELDA